MLRTTKLSKDTEDIYFILLQIFGKIAATKIMKFLLSNRTYNIQLIGSCGVGKSCFAQTLLTNTFRFFKSRKI
jgi:GTPase SAR1 family protein